jgi:cobalt-zinc-cadmium efflux system outer membrane protein
MHLRHIVFYVCCLLYFPGLLRAQEMSFDDLARLTIANNKDLQAARETVRQAEGRFTQARLRPNPSLEASTATDAIFSNDGDTNFSVGVTQPFELGGKRPKRMRVAETEVEVRKAEEADAERQLLGRLRLLIADATGAAARLELLQRVDQLNQQTVNVMTVRLRSGDASELDSRLLQAQMNQIRSQRLVAENQLDGILIQIRAIAGLPADGPLVLKQSGRTMQAGTEAAFIERALESRPDLRASRLREQLAEEGIVLAKSQLKPNIDTSIRYGRESVISRLAAPGVSRAFESESFVEFGVSVPLPIFNREQGNIADAVSHRSQARSEREALEQQIRREVQLAYRRYETSRRSMDILQSGVVEENRASLRIVQLAYNLGELRFLDIVNQQRVVVDAETSYVAAETELRSALADLELAAGATLNIKSN